MQTANLHFKPVAMKCSISCLLFILLSLSGQSQFIKNILGGIKSNAEQTALDKANQKINSTIDAATKPGVKKTGTKSTDTSTVETPASQPSLTEGIPEQNKNTDGATDPASTADASAAATDTAGAGGPSEGDGFVTMATSASTIFIGGNISVSGQSAYYGQFKSVQLIVKGPYTEDGSLQTVAGYSKQVLTIPLDKDGNFSVNWTAGGTDGLFMLTIVGSDAKTSVTKNVIVYDIPDLKDMADSNIEFTKKAYANLVKRVDIVKPNISPKDAEDLGGRLKKVKDVSDQAIQSYQHINDANKKLGAMVKKGRGLPHDLGNNLSELNAELSGQANDMAKMVESTDHEPSDNTICEYLEMAKEACSAFFTISNLATGNIIKILTAITIDKALPLAVEKGNKFMEAVNPDVDIILKEPGKLYASSKLDFEALDTKMFKAGIIADFTEFASDFLQKKYCGLYEGTLKHDYKVIFRNDDHETWWKYAVEMEATFHLRYPKGKTGRLIKMKGNIEGNATKFQFFADAKAAVKDKMQGRDKYVSVVVLQNLLPPAIPFSSSVHDKLKFGAVARAVATPAYFNIPVDAEYDLNTNKIKLIINPALVDFSSMVQNRQIYIALAVLPLVHWMNYPIFKAQETLKGSFKEKNEFDMEDAESPEPKFADKVTRHINNEMAPFEIFLNTSFEIKKEKE